MMEGGLQCLLLPVVKRLDHATIAACFDSLVIFIYVIGGCCEFSWLRCCLTSLELTRSGT